MREILFRGKKRNGEWVEGDLLHTTVDREPRIRSFGLNCAGVYDVIPETVGQFTGLTDKNGKKIFEGDIIQVKSNYRFLIKYGEYMPNDFCKYEYKDWKSFGLFATDGKADFQMSNHSHLFEVIGNVHDNPELMKGEGYGQSL